MSGRIDLFPYVLLPVAVVASTTDLLYSKIFNWLTLSTALAGFIAGFYFAGWNGLTQAALGLGAGLLLFGWIFALGQLGGGDVKYLMALGAWGGPRFALQVALLSVCLGGLLSLGSLTSTGRLRSFLSRIFHYFLSLWIAWSAQTPPPNLPKLDQSQKIPFALPISIAAILVVFFHPFETWGILP